MKPIFSFLLIFQTFFGFSAVDVNSSPYDVVYNHAHFLNKNTYDELQAAESFQIPNKKKRIEAAKQLYDIFSGKGINIKSILKKTPDNPNYIDSTSHRSIYYLDEKIPQVYVEKVGDKWYYSAATVEALPEIHKKVFPFGTNFWANWFPFHQEEVYLKLHPWQWIGIGIIIVAFLLTYYLLKTVIRFLFHRIIFKRYAKEIQDLEKLKSIANWFSLWIGFTVLQTFIPTLFISPRFSLLIINGVNFVAATIIVLVVYKLVELVIFYVQKYAQTQETKWNEQVVAVVQKFIKFLIVFIGLFYILNTLDVNLATLIAGLSVGGLALALASQDTVKNFIASVMIFADKPFKIGDNIRLENDKFEGIVQEVGFRSTRIKTADDSLVYISNAKLAEMIIDNKGAHIYKKYKTDLIISYNTTTVVLEKFLEGIRNILFKHPNVRNSTINVFVSNLTDKGISITISFSYNIYNVKEEIQYREFILMQILKLADVLEINLFENIQHYLANAEVTKNQLNTETINERVDKFFVDFNSQLTNSNKS
ncbi:MAG: mechanosensitive ion channel [Chitinophagales bacterium]|nr:mechanosensitive ion channel [Bacteroidota bacterium]